MNPTQNISPILKNTFNLQIILKKKTVRSENYINEHIPIAFNLLDYF
jgi:hypothetical protein